MLTHQELVSCLPARLPRGMAGRLSPFESALLEDSHERLGKPRLLQIIVFLGVLLCSLLYAPLAQTSEIPLEPGSVLAVLNQDRLKYGLGILTENPQLQAAASAKARQMLELGYFSHTSPTGAEPWDFIKTAGYHYAFAGENLALNYKSAYDLQQDFLGSPRHRENLLSPLFSEIGIAVVSGIYQGQPAAVTVQMFASPADRAESGL